MGLGPALRFTAPDARSGLMDAISQGNFKLRKSVAPPEGGATLAAARADPAAIGGLAGQIAAAMAARRNAGRMTSDRDDEDEDDEDW